MDLTPEAGNKKIPTALVLLFSAIASFLAFFGGVFALGFTQGWGLSIDQRVLVCRGILIAVTLGLLAVALALRKNTRLKQYWRLAFAYFTASCALVLSDYLGKWALALSGQALATVKGFTALKLGEDAAVIGTILLLTWLSRDNPQSLYLSRGRLKPGLLVGVTSFLLFSGLGIALTFPQSAHPGRVSFLLRACLLIALADGFMEELLFRGLFLRKLGDFLGDTRANLMIAVVFTLMHLGAQFTDSIPVFLAIVFLLGLAWGWIMQSTRSLLAPALFHAGVDMLIIGQMFASLGAS